MVALQRVSDAVDQASYLAVDDDGVQTFLATEVFVDDRLGHARLVSDLLDAGAVETLLGEECSADVEQLLASFLPRHPDSGDDRGCRGKGYDVFAHAGSTVSFAMRSRVGHRTSRTSRSFSITQMMRADESS